MIGHGTLVPAPYVDKERGGEERGAKSKDVFENDEDEEFQEVFKSPSEL